jgi:hypothetical protein
MPDGKLILVPFLGSFRNEIKPNFQALPAAVRGYKLDSIAAVHPRLARLLLAIRVLCCPGTGTDPMRAWIRRWFAEATDQAIIRVVATTVGLLAYIIWGAFSYFHPSTETSVTCEANCSTEFSSRHRTE